MIDVKHLCIALINLFILNILIGYGGGRTNTHSSTLRQGGNGTNLCYGSTEANGESGAS